MSLRSARRNSSHERRRSRRASGQSTWSPAPTPRTSAAGTPAGAPKGPPRDHHQRHWPRLAIDSRGAGAGRGPGSRPGHMVGLRGSADRCRAGEPIRAVRALGPPADRRRPCRQDAERQRHDRNAGGCREGTGRCTSDGRGSAATCRTGTPGTASPHPDRPGTQGAAARACTAPAAGGHRCRCRRGDRRVRRGDLLAHPAPGPGRRHGQSGRLAAARRRRPGRGGLVFADRRPAARPPRSESLAPERKAAPTTCQLDAHRRDVTGRDPTRAWGAARGGRSTAGRGTRQAAPKVAQPRPASAGASGGRSGDRREPPVAASPLGFLPDLARWWHAGRSGGATNQGNLLTCVGG
jgi:hypothetical protein